MKTELHFHCPRRGWRNWAKHLAWLLPLWVVAMLAWHGAAGVSLAAGMRKVTVRVSDFDTGEPLKGVEVKAFFSMGAKSP
ncbi:MAG: hypothetical protein IJT88_03840 [Kiritimatiellae bacterium]|nr:hypothetical protein [Kiritimatiellia bacterium]